MDATLTVEASESAPYADKSTRILRKAKLSDRLEKLGILSQKLRDIFDRADLGDRRHHAASA